MSLKRESQTWTKSYDARRIIEAMKKAAEDGKGIFASNLPDTSYGRQSVARLLRECGVPLMAIRRGSGTAWFIVSLFSEDTQKNLAGQWRTRIISDAYSEVCRAHMALSKQPFTQDDARVMAAVAVSLGDRLGYGMDEVVRDLTPSEMPSLVAGLLP